jgi:ferredoxin-NADP reductase
LYYNYVWLALIGQLLFITVMVCSIYIVRRRLKFESWYYVHLMVYAAIISVSLHQLAIGTSFVGDHPLARIYWLGLYGFVALNLLIWRIWLPIWNLVRFEFRIEKVVPETPSTTSVYIRGRGLHRFHTLPGQFILIRIFAKGFWWQEHPFSLSWIPHNDHLRITVRHVGDYTSAMAKLQPGKRVLISGPFGRFTHEVAVTNKRLFIAGGVGITPIRSLAEEALGQGIDCVLLYANRTPKDVVLKDEVVALAQKGLKTTILYSNPPKSYRGEIGYADIEHIASLVPDYKGRDVYLCGPAPMMNGIVASLKQAGFNSRQLHYERFVLHN